MAKSHLSAFYFHWSEKGIHQEEPFNRVMGIICFELQMNHIDHLFYNKKGKLREKILMTLADKKIRSYVIWEGVVMGTGLCSRYSTLH